MKIYTFDPQKNKKVLCGELVGNTFFRWVKPQHFMRINQSYGIQEIAFQEMIKRGADKIVLKEEGTDKSWEATVGNWKTKGTVADYGSGKQRFLSMKYQDNHKNPIVAAAESQHARDLLQANRFNQQTLW